MAGLSAQRVIETASDLAPEAAAESTSGTVLGLILARVQMALRGETGPARAALEARLAGPTGAARSRLAEIFGLSTGAMDLLDLACALAVDPSFAEAYAATQGAPHRVCPTEALSRTLFSRDNEPNQDDAVWRAGAPLSV